MAIGRVHLLGDATFLPRSAHRLIEVLARTEDVVGEKDRWFGGRQQCLEPLLASDFGKRLQVFPGEFEQIEGMELQSIVLPLRAMAALEHGLQRREITIAFGICRDNFVVNQAIGQVERGDTWREFVGPVLHITGINPNLFPFCRDQTFILTGQVSQWRGYKIRGPVLGQPLAQR